MSAVIPLALPFRIICLRLFVKLHAELSAAKNKFFYFLPYFQKSCFSGIFKLHSWFQDLYPQLIPFFPPTAPFLWITFLFPIPFSSHLLYNHSRYTVVCFCMFCTSSSVTVCLLKLSSSLEDVFFLLWCISRMNGFHARYNCISMSAIWVNR